MPGYYVLPESKTNGVSWEHSLNVESILEYIGIYIGVYTASVNVLF